MNEYQQNVSNLEGFIFPLCSYIILLLNLVTQPALLVQLSSLSLNHAQKPQFVRHRKIQYTFNTKVKCPIEDFLQRLNCVLSISSSNPQHLDGSANDIILSFTAVTGKLWPKLFEIKLLPLPPNAPLIGEINNLCIPKPFFGELES